MRIRRKRFYLYFLLKCVPLGSKEAIPQKIINTRRKGGCLSSSTFLINVMFIQTHKETFVHLKNANRRANPVETASSFITFFLEYRTILHSFNMKLRCKGIQSTCTVVNNFPMIKKDIILCTIMGGVCLWAWIGHKVPILKRGLIKCLHNAHEVEYKDVEVSPSRFDSQKIDLMRKCRGFYASPLYKRSPPLILAY